LTEPDEVLVGRSQRGDRAAFEELVRRFGRLVYARVYLEVGDAHRAEDLAQETFLVAWRKVGQLAQGATFRGWLMKVAQTVVVDAVRREGRQKRAGPRAAAEALDQVAGDDALDPARRVEDDEARERALAMLASLPDEYRAPLMLRYLGGSDYDTIGRQLGLSNGSLRGLLHRGLAMLRDKLARPAREAAVAARR